MFKRSILALMFTVCCSSSVMAATVSFESILSGTKGQQLFTDDVLFSTSSSNALSIRTDCGTPGKCLASIPSDVLYGWLVVELPARVTKVSFDFYASDAKLWIAGHQGSPGIDAKVTEQYMASSNWWRHATIDSFQPFDFITFTSVTNDKAFNNHPSVWIDNLTFLSPVPEPSAALLLVSGLAGLYLRTRSQLNRISPKNNQKNVG